MTDLLDELGAVPESGERRPPRSSGRKWLVAALVLVVAAGVGLVMAGAGQRPHPQPLPDKEFATPAAEVADPTRGLIPAIGETITAVAPGDRSWVVRDERLIVPSLGVDATIDVTALQAGLLDLPADVSRVALWDGSPPIDSDAGTILVAGHVDNIHQGPGALWPLHQVTEGSLIVLAHGGQVSRWKVVGVTSVVKSALPQDVFAGPIGPRRLVLVTCGGDIHQGSYDSNVIVTAVPLSVDER